MSSAPTRFNALAFVDNAPAGTPAQQAFRQAILDVENLRERLRELEASQVEARRQYWRQVGPLAEAVVQARRSLFAPLEEALLLAYFSRAEEQQITELLLANAHTLHERFGEEVADIVQKYAPTPRPTLPDEMMEATAAEAPPHQEAARQAQARRKTKTQKAQEAAERAAREEQQRLLLNTKTVYRQLARANHPDLERDPAVAAEKTTRMQRITAAYEANDLYTLLQLLSESAPTDHQADDVLTRHTQALLQQQTELKQRMNALKFGVNGFFGSTGKKQQTELRQLKRQLRAETDYVQHIGRLMQEPDSLRAVLRELAAAGQKAV